MLESVDGNAAAAATKLQKAIRSAQASGFLHDLALTQEFYARHLRMCGEDPGEMVGSAIATYRQGGAHGKASYLANEFSV